MPIFVKVALMLWVTTFLLYICTYFVATGIDKNPKAFKEEDLRFVEILANVVSIGIVCSIAFVLPVAVWFIFLR